MRISVIIPCRNASRWIGQALESVRAQSRAPDEVIVADDGSDDDSAEIAEGSGCVTRLVRVDYKNAAEARNAGIHLATGDWIAFLDADDIWEQDHLGNASTLLDSSNDAAYMGEHSWLRGNQLEAIPQSLRPKITETGTGLPDQFFPELMSRGFHFGHSTALLRRDAAISVGLFDATQVRRHDIDLWLRVIAGRSWTWQARPCARYRIDSEGSLSKNDVEAEYFFLRALLKNEANFPNRFMRQLIRTSSRRCMSLAFVDGSSADYERAKKLAWEHLPSSFRNAYRLAETAPTMFRAAIRLKRRWVWRGGPPN